MKSIFSILALLTISFSALADNSTCDQSYFEANPPLINYNPWALNEYKGNQGSLETIARMVLKKSTRLPLIEVQGYIPMLGHYAVKQRSQAVFLAAALYGVLPPTANFRLALVNANYTDDELIGYLKNQRDAAILEDQDMVFMKELIEARVAKGFLSSADELDIKDKAMSLCLIPRPLQVVQSMDNRFVRYIVLKSEIIREQTRKNRP